MKKLICLILILMCVGCREKEETIEDFIYLSTGTITGHFPDTSIHFSKESTSWYEISIEEPVMEYTDVHFSEIKGNVEIGEVKGDIIIKKRGNTFDGIDVVELEKKIDWIMRNNYKEVPAKPPKGSFYPCTTYKSWYELYQKKEEE